MLRMKDTSGAFRCAFSQVVNSGEKIVSFHIEFLTPYICHSFYYPLTRMHDGGEIDVRASYTAISVSFFAPLVFSLQFFEFFFLVLLGCQPCEHS